MYYIPAGWCITSGMVQPKKPPVSFRPGDERLARIDAFAEKHKLSRHLAILVLIDRGLGQDSNDADAYREAGLKAMGALIQQIEKPAANLPRAPYGSRLKKR